MDGFLSNISSFPTALYSTLLVVVLGYWLMSFIGTFDMDAFDAEVEIDGDVGEVSDLGSIAGLLTTLGLTGVPITIVISLLILNAWIICYFLVLFTPSLLESISLLKIAIGIGILVASFLASIVLSAIMIRPLRGLFRKVHRGSISQSLLGLSCRIRSSRADDAFGEAECIYEGASLILKVRTTTGEVFRTGDTVVLIEHDAVNDYFRVVGQDEFNQRMK